MLYGFLLFSTLLIPIVAAGNTNKPTAWPTPRPSPVPKTKRPTPVPTPSPTKLKSKAKGPKKSATSKPTRAPSSFQGLNVTSQPTSQQFDQSTRPSVAESETSNPLSIDPQILNPQESEPSSEFVVEARAPVGPETDEVYSVSFSPSWAEEMAPAQTATIPTFDEDIVTAANQSDSNTTAQMNPNYNFNFTIDFVGPSSEVCSFDDIDEVSEHLLAVIELLLNTYLIRNGLPGEVTNIYLSTLSGDVERRQLQHQSTEGEEVARKSEAELEQGFGTDFKRRLRYVWKLCLGATCRGCRVDSTDFRRFLVTEGIVKEEISNFMSKHLKGMILSTFAWAPESIVCRRSAQEWEGTFIWL